MEILVRGISPTEKEYVGDCYYCNTRVKFKAREGKSTYDQRDENYISVDCPVYGRPSNVNL
jgi:hypothetical protein